MICILKSSVDLRFLREVLYFMHNEEHTIQPQTQTLCVKSFAPFMKCLSSGHSFSSHTSNASFRFGYEGFLKWIYPLISLWPSRWSIAWWGWGRSKGTAFECIDSPWTFLSSSASWPYEGASVTGHIHVKVLCTITAQMRRPTTPLKPSKSWIRASLFSLQLLFWSILSQWQKSNEPNPSSTDRDACVGSSRPWIWSGCCCEAWQVTPILHSIHTQEFSLLIFTPA